MTFSQYWQEYCTKHRLPSSSPYTKALENAAKESWDAGFFEGYKERTKYAVESCLMLSS